MRFGSNFNYQFFLPVSSSLPLTLGRPIECSPTPGSNPGPDCEPTRASHTSLYHSVSRGVGAARKSGKSRVAGCQRMKPGHHLCAKHTLDASEWRWLISPLNIHTVYSTILSACIMMSGSLLGMVGVLWGIWAGMSSDIIINNHFITLLRLRS